MDGHEEREGGGDGEQLKGDGWERLALRTGGTVAALAMATDVEGRPLVFAGTTVGLLQSSDEGRTWSSVGGDNATPFVEQIAPSPNFARDPTIFVATRRGVFHSPDAGQTWRLLLTGGQVHTLAISPEFERDRVLFIGTDADGVLRTEDGGRSWASANPGLLDMTVLALALSPQFHLDRVGLVATASGLYRTSNGGKSWRAIKLELGDIAVQCVALSPDFAVDHLALAGTEAHGLLTSTDGGRTWGRVPTFSDRSVTAVAFSPAYPARRIVAVATTEGVAVSQDGGNSWQLTGEALGAVLSVTFVPGHQDALLCGLLRRGIARSEDAGATWVSANDGLHGGLLAGLVPSPEFARDGALFGYGPDDGVIRSTDRGVTWAPCNAGLEEPSVLHLAVSPAYARDGTLYAATTAGVARSRDGGSAWQLIDAPIVGVIAVVPASEAKPTAVLAAALNGSIRVSENGGDAWQPLGLPFGQAEVIALAASPDVARDGTVYAVTRLPSPDDSLTTLVVWRSVDRGVRWTPQFEEQGPDVSQLALDIAFDGTLFAGLGRRVLRASGEAHVGGGDTTSWRSAELGGELTAITGLVVAPEQAHGTTVFVSSKDGAYVSRDGGESFASWSTGLAPSSILALALSPQFVTDRLVFAVGPGGMIWRRRDHYAGA